MKKKLVAAALAASSLSAGADLLPRDWDGRRAYFDDVASLTWLDGLRDEYGIWNDRLVRLGLSTAPTLPQLVALNVARNTFGDPFEHLLDRGPPDLNLPKHTSVWTSTLVPCQWIGTPASPALCRQVPEGEPFDYMVPLVYSFGPGEGFWGPYQDDWPWRLSLRFAVGDVGIPIATAVPEPETWAVMIAGLLLLTRVSARRGRAG